MSLLNLYDNKATNRLKLYVEKTNSDDLSEIEIIVGYNNYVLSLHRELMYNPNEQLRVIASKELNYLVKTFESQIQQHLQQLTFSRH